MWLKYFNNLVAKALSVQAYSVLRNFSLAQSCSISIIVVTYSNYRVTQNKLGTLSPTHCKIKGADLNKYILSSSLQKLKSLPYYHRDDPPRHPPNHLYKCHTFLESLVQDLSILPNSGLTVEEFCWQFVLTSMLQLSVSMFVWGLKCSLFIIISILSKL